MPPRQVASSISLGLGWTAVEPISALPNSTTTTPSSTSSSPERSSADLASSHDAGQHDATMQAEDGNVSFGLQSVGLSSLYVHSNVPGSLQVFIPAAHSHEPLRIRLQVLPEELDGHGHHWEAAATATFTHGHTSPVTPPAQPGNAEDSSANGDREDGSLSSSMHDEEPTTDSSSLAASSPRPQSQTRRLPQPVPWNAQADEVLKEAIAANRGTSIRWKAVAAYFNHHGPIRHTMRGMQARWRFLESRESRGRASTSTLVGDVGR